MVLQNITINMHDCVNLGSEKTKRNKTKKHWKQRNSFTKDSLLIFLSYHIWLLIHRNIMSQFKGSIQTHSDCCSHPPSQKAADNSIRTKRKNHKSSLCWPSRLSVIPCRNLLSPSREVPTVCLCISGGVQYDVLCSISLSLLISEPKWRSECTEAQKTKRRLLHKQKDTSNSSNRCLGGSA